MYSIDQETAYSINTHRLDNIYGMTYSVADEPTNFHQMINIVHRTTNHQMSQDSVFVKAADYRPRDILLG
ncbi:uncharacterized protein Bfra_005286 [Botrytis fragariae]|uniref:Uncharacterized protein n=1 Tax=Botrytis fragariae TaxID=1964551 RepID=A0A8H6AUD4_9HELO|nr:uncharacterized protein Bfra_005286 [Botrytis fragariae]KAF5873819.1 hypothetical protein Bfra_005286 [Botrytis fragariae]